MERSNCTHSWSLTITEKFYDAYNFADSGLGLFYYHEQRICTKCNRAEFQAITNEWTKNTSYGIPLREEK